MVVKNLHRQVDNIAKLLAVAVALLFLLVFATPLFGHEVPYDRYLYGSGWPTFTDGCLDWREVVLYEAAEEVELTDGGCEVTRVELVDLYTGMVYRGSDSGVHIDHLVPLAEAHRSGADAWTEGDRRDFYLDLQNLVPVAARVNLQKSDKDPAEWLPPINRCWYVERWLHVKTKWGLDMDVDEARAVFRVRAECMAAEVGREPELTWPGKSAAATVLGSVLLLLGTMAGMGKGVGR